MPNSSHVVFFDPDSRLFELVRLCTSLEADVNLDGEIGDELKQFSVIEVSKCLEATLSSNDSSSRRLSVTTLLWLVRNTSPIDFEFVPDLLAFFCARLSDWACVEPSVQGIRHIYEHHLKSDVPVWAEPDDAISKDLADLQLLCNSDFTHISSWTLTARVLLKLLINVHAPSFGKSVRLEVLSLFELWLERYQVELRSVWELLIMGLTMESEDERDPECLLKLFRCVSLSQSLSSDLFETCLSSYFPVPPLLCDSMKTAFVHFGVKSVEFLLPFLADPKKCDFAFQIIAEIIDIKSDKHLTALLLHELQQHRAIPLLLGELWKKVNVWDESVWATFRVRNDIATLSAQSSEKSFALVLAWAAQHTNWGLVHQLLSEAVWEAKIDGAVADKILGNFLNDQWICCSCLIPVLTDRVLIEQLASRMVDSSDDSAAICRMFECHFSTVLARLSAWIEVAETRVKNEEHLTRIVAVLFESKNLKNHRLVTAEAIRTISGLAEWMVKRDDFFEDKFEAPILGALANSLKSDEFTNKILLDRIEVLAELDFDSIQRLENLEEKIEKISTFKNEQIAVKGTRNLLLVFSNECLWEFLESSAVPPPVWVAGMSALYGQLEKDTFLNLLVKQGDLERFEAAKNEVFFRENSKNLALKNLPQLVMLRVLSCLEDLSGHEEVLLTGVVGDVESCLLAHRLVCRYLFSNKATSLEFVSKVLAAITQNSTAAPCVIRFASMQLLAVLPEIVPSGKLGDPKQILKFLRKSLNGEPKMIVRKQIAMAITNWVH